MATDALLDFDRLLEPISDDEPCGESLRWDPLWDEISGLRKQKASSVDESGDTEADWPKVRDLAVEALESRTKDLMIASWLLESLIEMDGVAGLRDGFKLIHGLIEKFWPTLHPEIDEEDGDLGARIAPINWLAEFEGGALLPGRVREVALAHSDSAEAMSHTYRKSCTASPQREDEDEDDFSRRHREAEQRRETFDSAVTSTTAEFYRDLTEDIAQCREELERLENALDDKLGHDSPGWSALRQAFDDVEVTLRPILSMKGVFETNDEPADGEPDEDSAGDSAHAGGASESTGGGGGVGPLRTRADAIKRLQEVVDFLHRTEPHSPVAYLVQRAVKWAHQPFESVLSELVKDSDVLEQIEDVLGIKRSDDDDDD